MIRYLCVDPEKSGTVYLATAKGALASDDFGLTWHDLTEAGLQSRDVRIVTAGTGSKLYAAAKNGVFRFSNGQWQSLGTGLTAHGIHGLACVADSLYVACESGLFRLQNTATPAPQKIKSDHVYTKDLPSISAVQKAAIAYADVDIAKIREWHRQAAHRALLPKFDMGINKDTGDLWHWEGGSTTKDYDDILRKGKASYEWDVGLTWDFGDLIWNDSQTSIDTRARLLVQLRDDILDETTKLYFEYARTRQELDMLTFLDEKKRAEKEIRLQELAAQLDGLTDGFFTRNSSQ